MIECYLSVRPRESGDPVKPCPNDKAWLPASAGTNGDCYFAKRFSHRLACMRTFFGAVPP